MVVRIPPAGLTPIFTPWRRWKSRTASSMTSTTGAVAAGVILPVDVLMKSAPASMASQEARRTLSRVCNSPVSKMTFKWVSPQTALTATISSNTWPNRPDKNAPRSMTMSISDAPAATASAVS